MECRILTLIIITITTIISNKIADVPVIIIMALEKSIIMGIPDIKHSNMDSNIPLVLRVVHMDTVLQSIAARADVGAAIVRNMVLA